MLLPDDAARHRIRTDLGSTLFVEAGAGSGKTTALIERLLALIGAGIELRSIAAITFTEKAGAELRDRLRRALGEGTGPEFRRALDQLDGAAIGTLHAFAQTLLTDNPVEAGLPPAVEVLDEVTSGVEFERRWADFRDEMLADPGLHRPILLLTACGVRLDALRLVAIAFGENWDLVQDRVPAVAAEPPPVSSLVAEALEAFDAVGLTVSSCPGPDKLKDGLLEVGAWVAGVRAITDEVTLVEAITAGPPPVGRVGQRANWQCSVDEVRAALTAAREALEEVKGAIADACIARLAVELRAFTLDAAVARRGAGRLEFHDLLVLSRSLVAIPDVRIRLHRRYQRILLDEFQDTDPIQIELAVRIAALDAASEAAGADPWALVDVEPGRLFVVGDPKQSIYRFRRADISVFMAARQRLGGPGLVELTTNFRTVQPVIQWINAVFGTLMSPTVGSGGQAGYLPVSPVREAPAVGPPVSIVGTLPSPVGARADDLRSAEATDVVAAVTQVLSEGWTISSTSTSRAACAGDITVLVPTRTSLPFLEDAFETAGIPCRAESSSLVYASRAVRDLLMVLRAVDDPTDHLRVVAALRTPLVGCGDDDLFRYRVEQGGRWSYLGPPRGHGPVARGLSYFRELHDQRRWVSPSELLTKIAIDCRAFELGFVQGRPRDVWRRLRFVIDQARAWSDATAGSLRQYLQWVDQQTAEGARVAEAILPETDDDAVRIMTIHAAKGLEFPIVILSGMSTEPRTSYAAAQVVFPPAGGVGYRLGKGVTTPEYDEWKPIDEQMGLEERIRLLYVACTRARDHLVVSVRRKERAAKSVAKQTNAELLVDAIGSDLGSLPEVATPALVLTAPAERPARLPQTLGEWQAERDTVLASLGRPTTIAATALTAEGTPSADDDPDPGLDKRPRDLDLPPWQKGRYGTAVGRAVHGVLQTVDLSGVGAGVVGAGVGSGVAAAGIAAAVAAAGIAAAVAAQCEAEAIPDRADVVTRLVEHALAATCVREAAAAPHWREVYACTPLEDGRLLEGYVDLLYRGPHGLVVVDHKTAATTDPDDLSRRVEGYRLQGAAYALAVSAVAGEPVVRVVFLFLTPGGAVERDLTDLDAAVAEVARLGTSAIHGGAASQS